MAKALEIALPHLAPVDEERREPDRSRGAIEARAELGAERARLDGGEHVAVDGARPRVRGGPDPELHRDPVRADGLEEWAHQQRDRHRHRNERSGHREPAPHAARPGTRSRRPNAKAMASNPTASTP